MDKSHLYYKIIYISNNHLLWGKHLFPCMQLSFKFLSEFCSTSSHRDHCSILDKGWISLHLWQPDVSLQGAGGRLSTHCSALLSRAAASTLLSTKKVQCRHQKSSFLWGFNIMKLFRVVLPCFALHFCTESLQKRAQWGKASLRDIYATLFLRQCTLKSWLNCFYIITFTRHMHPYFPGMRPEPEFGNF